MLLPLSAVVARAFDDGLGTFWEAVSTRQEAMSVADLIVVMNEGRIEQVGHPRELYEPPPTSSSWASWARSAGWASASSARTTSPSTPRRSRVACRPSCRGSCTSVRGARELRIDGAESVDVQITRDDAERLGMAPGEIVWVRPPRDERVLDVA